MDVLAIDGAGMFGVARFRLWYEVHPLSLRKRNVLAGVSCFLEKRLRVRVSSFFLFLADPASWTTDLFMEGQDPALQNKKQTQSKPTQTNPESGRLNRG